MLHLHEHAGRSCVLNIPAPGGRAGIDDDRVGWVGRAQESPIQELGTVPAGAVKAEDQ